jgi:hypothetical protein
MKRIALLLVWAVVVAGVDAVVIVRRDADPKPVSRPAPQSTPTRASATSPPTTISDEVATTHQSLATDPTTPASSGEAVVAQTTGDGNTPSVISFRTNGRWELRWRVDDGGPGVAVTVDDDETGSQRLFSGLVPGDGSLAVEDGCRCTLHVTPDGSSYDVTVVDVAG